MRIQITNDDGIGSEGLQVLAAAVHRAVAGSGHEVVVAAPSKDWSGAGASIGIFRPDEQLSVERMELDGAPGVEAWAIDGPPALTVLASRLGAVGDPPDLIVSGTNAGWNNGRLVLHSGTVGAVLTGQNFGVSGLAVSVASPADGVSWEWETAADVAVSVLPLLMSAPPRSALNLNVPSLAGPEVRGVRWARLAPFGAVRAAVASREDGKVQFELVASEHTPDPDTDVALLAEGYATLTALVGVTEAWSSILGAAGESLPEVHEHVVPGAPLLAVHEVPGGHDWSLHRPVLGEDVTGA